MDIESSGPARRNRLAAVACACAAVHGWGLGSAHASDPRANTGLADLAVSASVVRRCVVVTPARITVGDGVPVDVRGSVTVVCSPGGGEAPVFMPPPAASAGSRIVTVLF